MAMPLKRQVLRVEEDGRLTLPPELREKLRLRRADVVSVVETREGILLTNVALIADGDRELVDATLQEQGLLLDDLTESGREMRGELLKGVCDLSEPGQ